jgi:hypothetical protein
MSKSPPDGVIEAKVQFTMCQFIALMQFFPARPITMPPFADLFPGVDSNEQPSIFTPDIPPSEISDTREFEKWQFDTLTSSAGLDGRFRFDEAFMPL